jgi:hypothetical protein
MQFTRLFTRETTKSISRSNQNLLVSPLQNQIHQRQNPNQSITIKELPTIKAHSFLQHVITRSISDNVPCILILQTMEKVLCNFISHFLFSSICCVIYMIFHFDCDS